MPKIEREVLNVKLIYLKSLGNRQTAISKNLTLRLMKKERKGNQFIKSPQYSGGLAAMRKFIADNLKYPKEALKNKIEGSVYIRYGINNKGIVITTKVISGLGHGCDEEAKRLVRLMKFEVEKIRKLRVIHHKKIRVWFKIKQEAVKPASQVQYSIKPANKSEPKAATKKSYSYTIKIS